MIATAPHAAALASIPAREDRVTVLGSDTWFTTYGPADAARTLVLVHGYRGDHHGLEPVVARLPEFRIIAPDLPGFGHSGPMTEAPHSIAGYAAWLAEFVRAVGAAGEVVLGHSFGSLVASRAVADGLPAAGLILVNPISTDPAEAAGAATIGLTRAFYAVGRRLPERAGRAWLGNPLVVRAMSLTLAKTPDRALRRWIHQEHDRYFSGFSDAATVSEGFDASLSAQVGDVAERVTVPTLMIAGEIDLIAPLAGQRRTVELFPEARLEVIPGVGHLIHYETPGPAADLIRGFVETLA